MSKNKKNSICVASLVILAGEWMTLQPGSSIGLHKYGANKDMYIAISSEGVSTDSEGKESLVKAGDITIARAEESHALRNNGEPLSLPKMMLLQSSKVKIEKS